MSEIDPINDKPLPFELDGLDPSKETFAETENATNLWLYRAANIPTEYLPADAGSAKDQLMAFLFEQLDPSLGPVNMGIRSVIGGLAADASRAEDRYRNHAGSADAVSGYVNDCIRDDLTGLLDIFVAGKANKE